MRLAGYVTIEYQGEHATVTPSEKIDAALRLLDEARSGAQAALNETRGAGRGQAMQTLHRALAHFEAPGRYHSQAGQDRLVEFLLQGKRDGVFADIGGYDGVTGSNTLHFEQYAGWTGILVEPSPVQMRKAQQVRRCTCLQYAVAGSARELDFMEVTAGYTQMSGFLDSYDANLLARVRGDARHTEVVHRLQARPLGDILAEAGLRQIDYLSLDVEGAEMDILGAFDFDAFDIDIWSIENNTRTPDIPALMTDRGYDLVDFAGVDEIYRKRSPQ